MTDTTRPTLRLTDRERNLIIAKADLPPAVASLQDRLTERGHRIAGFRRAAFAFPGTLTAYCEPCGRGIYVDDEGRQRGGAMNPDTQCRRRP